MNAAFADLEAQALADVVAEGFARDAAVLHRRLDLRYVHQGYQLTVDVPARELTEDDRPAIRAAFDALHRQVYGQSAEGEEVEIVTFRLSAEIAVDRFAFPVLSARRAGAARTGTRPMYNVNRRGFVDAGVYAREQLSPGEMVAGPAVINQFDATTIVLAGQRARVDSYGTLTIEEEA
jgi:N-methylhydantoinase A